MEQESFYYLFRYFPYTYQEGRIHYYLSWKNIKDKTSTITPKDKLKYLKNVKRMLMEHSVHKSNNVFVDYGNMTDEMSREEFMELLNDEITEVKENIGNAIEEQHKKKYNNDGEPMKLSDEQKDNLKKLFTYTFARLWLNRIVEQLESKNYDKFGMSAIALILFERKETIANESSFSTWKREFGKALGDESICGVYKESTIKKQGENCTKYNTIRGDFSFLL